MTISNKQIVEAIGIIAVVASLVFVGLQLRLDRRIAIADQYFNRAESTKANLRTDLESEAFYSNAEEMWELGERPSWWDESSDLATLVRDGSLSVRNLHYQITSARIGFLGFDSNYFQYQQGLLNEEFWQSNRNRIRFLMESSELQRNIYLNTGRPLSAVAREIANEIGL